LRQRALALGYNEAVSLTFISHDDAERFSSSSVLELENPLSEEASVMRTSMAPGMLEMLAWNLNRDVEDPRLFEMGRVYEMRDGKRIEPTRACMGASLAGLKASLPASALDVSKGEHAAAAEAFRSFKGDVENLLASFACAELTFDRKTSEYFHPGRSARALMDGAPVAQFGQISDVVKIERKLRQDVFLAEIDLEQLHARGLRQPKFAPTPKYPAVERDFSFVFADDVEFAAMQGAVNDLHLPALREFKPVELFRGPAIGAGKYSILVRARLQSNEATLRDEKIAHDSAQIIKSLQTLGGVQRA
jgi:phenylalanyl-tRNA synthetase beta chain